MTPAIEILRKKGITYLVHEYQHNSANTDFGKEAVEKLATAGDRIFKTIVIKLSDADFVVGVVPVVCRVHMKKIAKIFGCKKASLAVSADVQRLTGYVLGGVSPLGQRSNLKIVIDNSACNFETILVSGGKRGVDLELNPQDLKNIINAVFADISNS